MDLLYTLIVPPLLALTLCLHLGYAWARLALPPALQPYRALLTPLVGLALFLAITSALTTVTALTPVVIAAGLAIAAVPLNLWAWRRPVGDRRPATGDRRRGATLQRSTILDSGAVVTIAVLLFVLAILPPLRWGVSTPIGSNWDPADVYVPLGRALQYVSQRDVGSFPRNPLLNVIATPPVTGRIHSFSFLQAATSSASGVEPLRSFAPLLAFVLALQPPATYVLARVVGLGRGGALLGTALAAAAWLPLWVANNGFAEHVAGLPLLSAALAGSVVALRDGGRAALWNGGLLTAGLACAYYPAVTAYVAMIGAATLYLAWRAAMGDRRPQALGSQLPALGWRLLALGALSALLSAPAQLFFFLQDGFLDEIRRGNSGFQISSFVPPADMLGLESTFRDSLAPGNRALVVVAAAAAALLILAAVLGRRVPLLIALALGSAAYQGYAVANDYHYAFYKGATFAAPLVALLFAAGAEALWRAGAAQGAERSPLRAAPGFVAPASAVVAVALVTGLNLATIWGVQASYSAGGPRLWSAGQTAIAGVRAEAPPGASVLVVPAGGASRTFNSLVSYALLGNELFGDFSIAYSAHEVRPKERLPDFALLPDDADPQSYGYRAEDLRWSGAGMRLYARVPGVRYHRTLGSGGRYPALAPGETMTLRVGARRIALPGEGAPDPEPTDPARLGLAVATFGPGAIEVRSGDASAAFELPGGLLELGATTLPIPGEVEVRNIGGETLYLWWADLRDPEHDAAPRLLEEAFVQALPSGEGPLVATDLRLRTLPLPEGSQKLTGLVVVSRASGSRDWREIGQWVFFPSAGDYRFETDLATFSASLSRGTDPVDLIGGAQPAGDGRYQAALLLANDARVIYGTTLWRWRIAEGRVTELSADAVSFDVIPLPRPASELNITAGDGLMRLRGFTLAGRNLAPGSSAPLHLVWQSLRKTGGDLQARVSLRDGAGRTLAERSGAIGVPDRGTGAWLEGEVSDQALDLDLPRGLAPGAAALFVELLGPDGAALPFDGGETALKLADVEIGR